MSYIQFAHRVLNARKILNVNMRKLPLGVVNHYKVEVEYASPDYVGMVGFVVFASVKVPTTLLVQKYRDRGSAAHDYEKINSAIRNDDQR